MAEKRTIELEVKESGFKSLKAQLREAQADVAALSDKFGVTSKEATDAARAAGILKDKIADAKDLTDAFNPDAKFNALSSSIGGVLNGFQAYEGAMGLIGVESEDLQKTLLKVQSAMALSQGIQGALEAKDSFVQLGAVVKTAFTGMTAASKAFMVGGIGLLIGAIGLLVANWDNLTSSASKAAEEQRKLAAQTKAVAEAAKEQRESVSKESAEFATLISRLKDTNAGSKEREDLIKKVNAQYGTTLKNLKDETAFQSSLNSELANYLEYQKAKYILQSREELITKNLAKQDELNAKINKDKKELIRLTKEQEKADKEAGKASQQTVTGGGTAGGFGGATTYQESYEKAAKKSSLAVKEQQQSIKDLEQQLESAKQRFENYGSAANNAQNNIDKLTNGGKKYVEQVETQTKVVTDATEKINKNAIEGSLELRKIKEFDNEISLDMLKKQVDAEALITKEARDKERDAVAAALKEREKQRNEAFTLDAAKEMLDIIGDLAQQSENKFKALNAAVLSNQETTDAQKQKLLDENNKRAKKAFEIQKAASIASTLINTYMAARSAYLSQFLPIPDPSSPIRGGIAAGLSVAGGLVAVKNIASQKFEGASLSGGGGGGGGSMGGGGAPTAPNFNIVGNSGINQLAELGGQPIQAYVVSGEVTSAQALDRNRIQNATF
jgi:hypothetical protein